MFPRLAELPLQAVGGHLSAGDLTAAALALDHPAAVAHPLIDELRVPVVRHWLCFLQGDLALAFESLRAGPRSGAEVTESQDGLTPIFAALLAAGCHLERQQIDLAATELGQATRAAAANERPVLQHLVDLSLIRLAIAQGSHGSALAALAQARLAFADPDRSVLARLALEEYRIAVAFTPELADDLNHGLAPGAEAGLLRSRLLIRRGARLRAAQVLASVQPTNLRERIEWEVLSSLAAPEHDLTTAHGHLRTALELAQPHGYLATIIEQAPGVVPLLRSLPATAGLHAYVEQLLAGSTPSGPAAHKSPAALHTDLSSRELDVLGLLSSRLTTHEIAEMLYISPNTLKSHLKNIYRKLDVNSRADARLQAEALGLL